MNITENSYSTSYYRKCCPEGQVKIYHIQLVADIIKYLNLRNYPKKTSFGSILVNTRTTLDKSNVVKISKNT